MELAEQVFALTEPLPRKEDYGLTSQIRRSALSCPATSRKALDDNTPKDKLNFYYVARGSLTETKSHLIYGSKVGYFQQSELTSSSQLIQNIWEELNKLINSFTQP